jgi:glycosyltransferase involved in cell wall biosynthesis
VAGADVPGPKRTLPARPSTIMHLITTLGQGGAERMLTQVVPRPTDVPRGDDGAPSERHVVVSLVPGGMFLDHLVAAGVEVRDLGMRPGRDVLRGVVRLARLLRELRPALVISWMYHASLLDLLARGLAGRARRARMVWMLRGALDTGLGKDSGLRLHTRMTIRLLAQLSHRPEAVVVNSRTGRSHHIRAGFRPRRWLVRPNGCDTARFYPDPDDRDAVRAQLGITPGSVVAMSVARVHPQKDHRTLLAALRHAHARHPELAVVLVGTGTEALSEDDPSLPRIHGLGERTDVARLLRAADLVVSSSLTEGLPNALLEAMASGLVPVATDVGDCRHVVGDTGYVVASGDADALAAAVRAVIELPASDRAALGARARERVMQDFALTIAHAEYRGLWDPAVAAELAERPRDPGPLRIVHVIARMNVGGPARILAGLLSSLDPFRFLQTLLTGSVGPGEQDWYRVRDTSAADDPRIVPIEGLGRAISPLRDLATLGRLTRTLVALEPDVVQTHTAKAGFLGRRAALRAGVPHIVHTFHGHTLHGYFPAPVTALFSALERRLARRSDDLVAVGERVRDELLAAGIGALDQYTVIPPGVPDEGVGDRAAARRSLGLPEDGTGIVAFVGRLSGVKRPDRFLAAAEVIADRWGPTVFLVVGDGEERADLEARPRRADVRFLGWRGDVSRIYAAADLVVVTSDNEGMPVTLIEAAMAGRACVTTDVGSAGEVVLDGTTGLVVPCETSAVATAIESLLDDDVRREAFGMAARDHALASFGSAVVDDRLTAIYRRGPLRPRR